LLQVLHKSSILSTMVINPLTTALMPVSQTVAWYLLLTPSYDLFKSVSGISAFYCAWALFKRLIQGESKELGHISMGLLAVASFMEKKNFSIAATSLVLANFALPAYFIFSWSAEELAKKIKKTTSEEGIIWAWIFKVYFVSSICFWSFVLYRFIKMPSDYSSVQGS
jgi:hypothetical protein